MAKILFKIGNWAVNHSKKIIGASIGILVILVVIALSMGPSFEENMSIPGTESEKALKTVEKAFPQSDDTGGEVQLVFKAPKDKTLESENVSNKMQEVLDLIKTEDKSVVSTATPFDLGNLNKEKTIGYATVIYDVPATEVTEKSKEIVLDSIESTREAGIQTELAGSVAFSEIEVGGITEVLGVVVAFVILALTFTSFLVAGMPILTAAIGLGIGLMLILIGTNMFEITSFSLTLAAMLGLAVGIDYALFIVSRFRQQLTRGYSVKESVAIANGTAGSAVVFAGITVIVALLGLAVADIPFLTAMGISAAMCVLIAIIIAVIVVPAILGLMGHKIGPNRKNGLLQKMKGSSQKTDSNKWGKFVTKRPLLVTILGIGLLTVITLPFFNMELGLPDNGTKSDETTERRAYDLLSEAYGPGYHANLVIAAKIQENTENPQDALNNVIEQLEELPNIKSLTPPIPGATGDLYIMNLTPEKGPDDLETKELVSSIRDKSELILKEQNIEVMVTGLTAVNIDISQKLNDALPLFAALIVGFAFILLVLVFRSILVPLKAVLGFLLSLGATLGFIVFVIQDGNLLNIFGLPTASPVLSFLPVIVVGILFGLAMDYEVFLVSRMREVYSHTGDAKKAILAGMKDSGGVVTAAGLIMISVFAGFMFAPDPIIKQMGLALTFGVLFDAFIVRMAIVPAVMSLMGKAAWYLPKWLDNILPDLDIEGESIMRDLEKKDSSVQNEAV
ncbi:MMPL family transporter [Metabacillus litoralis]|uniref:MMPL family transporter n=1 Tax=Metabacillus litoralis TaxID=152268 RepID=UPI0020405987|nr:MMPL family transporter [Metabacillus litoralis]MCM3160788.1 MMPL family transporter [Metabacillus litoralis]